MYSRAIEGVRDARVLAELFRRMGCELPALAEIKPTGQGATADKTGCAVTTPGGGCRPVPDRTKAGVGVFVGSAQLDALVQFATWTRTRRSLR